MKKLFKNKALSLGDKMEVGIPFGKTYYKRTPKIMRVIGDGMLAFSMIVPIIGAVFVFPPVVIAIASSAGIAGKYISNCFGNKE
jgi:hypothetical protein